MKSKIPNTLMLVVVGLVLLQLLIGTDSGWHTLAMTGMLLLGGLYWLFGQRLPGGFVRNLILLFIGPTLLPMLLQIGLGQMRTLQGPQALLFLLAAGGLMFLLGRKWHR